MRFLLAVMMCGACSQNSIRDGAVTRTSVQGAPLPSQASANANTISHQPMPEHSDTVIEAQPADAPSVPPPKGPGRNVKNPPTAPAPEARDEAISPPSQVSGASLHCFQLLPPGGQQAYLGCRFQDENGIRVAASLIARTVTYDFVQIPEVGLSVSIRPSLAADTIYETFIDVQGNSADSVTRALGSLQITTKFEGRSNGESDGVVTTEVAAVTTPADKQGGPEFWIDYCTGEYCDFQDNSSGLFWSAYIFGQALSFNDAKARCESYATPTARWRLPTLSELMLARSNGVSSSRHTREMGLINGPYWSTSSGAGGIQTLNLKDNSGPMVINGNRIAPYICVTE